MKWTDPKLRKLDIEQGSGICDSGSSPKTNLLCSDGSDADTCTGGPGAVGVNCSAGPAN